MTQRKVLITGAAGRIGQVLVQAFTPIYDLILTDCKQSQNGATGIIHDANIADLEAIRPLFDGVDTVIHMAGNPAPNARWESILPNNIIGTYNVFQAAADAGCRRVIFASSIHSVYSRVEDERFIPADAIPLPNSLYGASKATGEAIGSVFAQIGKLSAICLRIGWVVPAEHPRILPDNKFLRELVTTRDLTQIVQKSVDAPDDLRYAVLNALSDNDQPVLDISETKRLLGYVPQDHAQTLAQQHAEEALKQS